MSLRNSGPGTSVSGAYRHYTTTLAYKWCSYTNIKTHTNTARAAHPPHTTGSRVKSGGKKYNLKEAAGLRERRHQELMAHKLSIPGQHDVSRRSAVVDLVQAHTNNAGGGRDMDLGRPGISLGSMVSGRLS